ncbi:hypothetical protein GCM10010492_25430 [Saccharothrix mutabilis subsp. mutabilis]|uniref:Rieske domain-containing protein n=1 Tax=Saccharothrix mutabilis subsp. mutabilis TaxID=66855 RepID=A0ABN0TNC5_9PSEU
MRVILGLAALAAVAVLLVAMPREPVAGRAVVDPSTITVEKAFAICREVLTRSGFEVPAKPGPAVVRSSGFVLVGSTTSHLMACTRSGSNVGHESSIMGPGIAEVPVCPCARLAEHQVFYGYARADVASVTLHTEDGREITALVGSGAFVADVSDLSEDEASGLRVEAFNAAGQRLSA